MTNSLLGNAAPTFDDPLEMLRACHGRIEAQCVTLGRLVVYLSTHRYDEQAVQAAHAILRYFDTAGQHHHQDEEQDLFPQLLSTQNSSATLLVTRLLLEHQGLETAWRNLRLLLVSITEGDARTLDRRIVEHFIEVYARHIETENGSLLPLAATLLNTDQLRLIGRNMAARRRVSL